DPQCCALLRVGVGTVHNGILQDSVRIPKCPLSQTAGLFIMPRGQQLRALETGSVATPLSTLPHLCRR
ncbi:hypothetical protein, partial [Corynebacterium diphtheriae]